MGVGRGINVKQRRTICLVRVVSNMCNGMWSMCMGVANSNGALVGRAMIYISTLISPCYISVL